MTEILQTLKEYIPISLEEMSGIKLMNRTDTKYVTSYQILKEILLAAGHDYRVQEVNGEYNIAYHTIYLDTADRDMYLTHQNGKIKIIREEQTRRESASGVLTRSKKTVVKHFYVNMPGMSNHNFCLCLKTHFAVLHLSINIKPSALQLIQE